MYNDKQLFIVYDDLNRDCKAYLEQIGYNFHFASFKTMEQAKRFLNRFNITLKLFQCFNGVTWYECNKKFIDSHFWRLEDLPKGAKKFKMLSNGSIVDGYYKITRKEVIFYRPNPNAKDIYKPLELKKHLEFQKENGIY